MTRDKYAVVGGMRFVATGAALVLWAMMCLSHTCDAGPSDKMEFTFAFGPPRIEKGATMHGVAYSRFKTSQSRKSGRPGEPVLPFEAVRILVPQNKAVQRMEVIPGKKLPVDGQYLIEYG